MAIRRKAYGRETQLGFEALSIEGGLLSPEWLSRAAQLGAGGQGESDYRVPKGLALRDEIGRYWRVAQAYWGEFAAGRVAKVDASGLSERFVSALLREALGFGSLAVCSAPVIAERTYPVGHVALGGRVPVVIAPADVGLDSLSPTFGDSGRRRSAFGLAQEFLNAEPSALWGIASDGVTLRILRDNASLTRPAWVEADLQRIFTEERYADFAALWLLAHETRFGKPDQPPTECALETWRNAGREEGTRAREHLRRGVEEALLALGQGFLSHPDNAQLRSDLHNGTLRTADYFNQLLRLVYRLIFLLTVEERGLLHPEGSSDAMKTLYASGYSVRRLRERAVKRSAHDRHADLWEGTKIVLAGLAVGEPRLGLPALAGIFARSQCPALDVAKVENRALLLAVFKLAWLREGSSLARVNWRDMGPEELGSVYESLLELVPQITQDGRQFAFATGGETKGNARKTSGSYYTPDSLVQVLLDSALEPVVAETLARNPTAQVEALLGLSIVDPACGSGHFLLAAARRLAGHVAKLQANGTPSAAQYRHALRQVVARCVYGVDLNPMAVELCKVSLWMEAVEPGLPLTFLNAHIQHGNALLGTTPELMAKGIPDAAWEPIEGDDKKIASALKKQNKTERTSGLVLDFGSPPASTYARLGEGARAVDAEDDTSLAAVDAKARHWEELVVSTAYAHQRFVADLWCATFVWRKEPGALREMAPTEATFRTVQKDSGRVSKELREEVRRLTEEYTFFHWHLGFPQVFIKGGFDIVLGNPPWEELTPSAKEFFSRYDAEIRFQDKSGEEAISKRLCLDPAISLAWAAHCRRLFGEVHTLKTSGRHLLFAPGNLGKGDFNVYRMFVETALSVTRPGGMTAQFVPETLYSGATTMAIRRKLFEKHAWRVLMGLENAGEIWFRGVDTRAKFCLYAAVKGEQTQRIRAAFNIHSPVELQLALRRTDPVYLTPFTIERFSPEALAIMEVSSPEDLEIANRMHEAWPAFGGEGLAPVHRHMRELDMTNDSGVFRDLGPGVPLYEGRMVAQFDHRAKGYASGKARSAEWVEFEFIDAKKCILPQFYVRSDDLPEKLGTRPSRYRVGFCNIASPTNERTLVATIIPAGVVCGNKVPTLTFDEGYDWFSALWVGVANSFAMDFLARKKVSLTMTNTIVDSLPFPRVEQTSSISRAIVPLVARLCCVGSEMQAYWNTLAEAGWVPAMDTTRDGLVSSEARAHVIAELNAAVALYVFHLSHRDLEHILDTFPIVERRDRKIHGKYRTKELILEIYDAMATATQAGKPYQTRLDPPVAHPQRASSPRGGTLLHLPTPPRRRSPLWGPDVVAEAASLGQGRPVDPNWRASLLETELGLYALAAALRSVEKPCEPSKVEMAVVHILLPRLLLEHLDSAGAKLWRKTISRTDMKRDSIAAFKISWQVVINQAARQKVLSVEDGLWGPGPDVNDAPSPELDVRARVAGAWLATSPQANVHATTEREALHAVA